MLFYSRILRVLVLCVVVLILPGVAKAGDLTASEHKTVDGKASVTDCRYDADPIYRKGRCEVSLESAYTFINTSSPFVKSVGGTSFPNPLKYELAIQILSLRYQLYDPCGPWLLRGTTEISGSIVGSAILRGPEDYFVGGAFGLRYYFIQPKAWIVPYVEGRVGIGQTNSDGAHFAQQIDLAFTYLIGAGFRYDANKHWSVTLGVIDQHMSNGYLAKPNNGFDSVGLSLGAIRRF